MNPTPIYAAELADFLGCRLEGDGTLLIRGVETIEDAGKDHLTFLANNRYRKLLNGCRAGAILIAEEEHSPEGMVRLVSEDPYRDFRLTVDKLYPVVADDVVEGVHPESSVDGSAEIAVGVRTGSYISVSAGARIGKNTVIHSGSRIGKNAVIGENSIIGMNVSIRHEVSVGDRVIIGDGSVIGYDGFGYTRSAEGYTHIHPVGTVIIEDDAEIGANCCIDRATVGATRVGRGVKLDNLIQVAHGVQIGEHTVVAAQAGISGSTKIGSNVMVGGQVGLVGHIEIGDGMILGAQAGITKSFDIHEMISGYPARPQKEAKRIEASMSRLPELLKRFRRLEGEIKDLRKKLGDD